MAARRTCALVKIPSFAWYCAISGGGWYAGSMCVVYVEVLSVDCTVHTQRTAIIRWLSPHQDSQECLRFRPPFSTPDSVHCYLRPLATSALHTRLNTRIYLPAPAYCSCGLPLPYLYGQRRGLPLSRTTCSSSRSPSTISRHRPPVGPPLLSGPSSIHPASRLGIDPYVF